MEVTQMSDLATGILIACLTILTLVIALAICVRRKQKEKEQQLQNGSADIAKQAAAQASKRYRPHYMVLEPTPTCQCVAGELQVCLNHNQTDENSAQPAPDQPPENHEQYAAVIKQKHSSNPHTSDQVMTERETPHDSTNDDTEDHIYSNRMHQGPIIDWRNRTDQRSPPHTSRTRSLLHTTKRAALQPQRSLDETGGRKFSVTGTNGPSLYSVVELVPAKSRSSDGASQAGTSSTQQAVTPDDVEWEENILYEPSN